MERREGVPVKFWLGIHPWGGEGRERGGGGRGR